MIFRHVTYCFTWSAIFFEAIFVCFSKAIVFTLLGYTVVIKKHFFLQSHCCESKLDRMTCAGCTIHVIRLDSCNKIHFFLRLLQEKKLLLRLYTQNIDNLETVAGIRSDKLIEAHGSFRTATCIKCKNDYPGSFVEVCCISV